MIFNNILLIAIIVVTSTILFTDYSFKNTQHPNKLKDKPAPIHIDQSDRLSKGYSKRYYSIVEFDHPKVPGIIKRESERYVNDVIINKRLLEANDVRKENVR